MLSTMSFETQNSAESEALPRPVPPLPRLRPRGPTPRQTPCNPGVVEVPPPVHATTLHGAQVFSLCLSLQRLQSTTSAPASVCSRATPVEDPKERKPALSGMRCPEHGIPLRREAALGCEKLF